ncbi:MAG: glycerophosphodiester phosphodiesterase [Pseudomonadales bacterium]
MMHPFFDHPGCLAFAHRGDRDAGPENTLIAFEGAVQQGFRYLETDVHCTRDGVLLAFHDDRLDRVTNRSGVIAELSYDVIQSARVGGTEPIPRLDELLESFPDTRFNIDPKSDTSVVPLIRLIQDVGAQDRICIGSFSDQRIRRVREALPGVCTSMGPIETLRARIFSFGIPTGTFDALAAQVPIRWNGIKIIDQRFVDAMHRSGLQIHVWTVNEPNQMEELLDMGIDGIMTDRPATLKQILVNRQQWMN